MNGFNSTDLKRNKSTNQNDLVLHLSGDQTLSRVARTSTVDQRLINNNSSGVLKPIASEYSPH